MGARHNGCPMATREARPATLSDAIEYFADPQRTRRYLISMRWPNGIVCPRCGSRIVYFDSSRDGWECRTRHPKRKFTLKTGTIFEDSPLGFDKWLPAIWLIATHARATARGIRQTVGVTQRTAWFMLQRVRITAHGDETAAG
jgi:transposase-like protein